MVRAIIVYLAVAMVATVEAACLNAETIPASLLISLFVIPNILVFVLLEHYLNEWRRNRHIAFFMALLPMTGIVLYGLLGPTEDLQVRDLSKLFGFWYFSQAIVAYLLLILTGGKGD